MIIQKGCDAMKLEKVNDHQIRCTLTKADLADRELKLSELAYGTEKAKSLFRDMMAQAAYEFGFEAEDIPLMIEAIPLSSDSIVLIITKVEDPEELDTRFSNFAPSVHEGSETTSALDDMLHSLTGDSEGVLDLFKKLHEKQAELSAASEELSKPKAKKSKAVKTEVAAPEVSDLSKGFSFSSLDDIEKLSKMITSFYNGRNSIYKDNKSGRYILIVTKSQHSDEDFNRVCNMISEYGKFERITPATEAFLNEQGCALIKNNALEVLSGIN